MGTIQISRTSLLLVDSLTTVLSTRTSCSSRVVSWVQERDKSPSESLFWSQALRGTLTRLMSSSLILPPRLVTVSTRPSPKKTNSSDLLLPSKRHEEFDRILLETRIFQESGI